MWKRCILVGIVIKVGCTLHALLVWSRSLRSPLINKIEFLNLTFFPLVYNFQFRKRTLIHRMVSLTNCEDLYDIDWTFISGVPCSEFREKNIEVPIFFLLSPLDLHGIHLQRKGMRNFTFTVQHFSNFILDGCYGGELTKT